jgi:hypothetical protein
LGAHGILESEKAKLGQDPLSIDEVMMGEDTINSEPPMPLGKPGKFSTSVVVVN